MKRRDFIRKSVSAGVIAGTALSFGGYGKLFARIVDDPLLPYDLVAVRDGEPGLMLDKALEALGGIQKFVKKGQTVVIKPNIGWDVEPEKAANTNPLLIKRLISHCFTAGAKEVYVFDNTCDNWTACYKNSGIEKATKDAGAKIAPAHSEGYFQQVSIPNGKNLKEAKVHELILSSDVFINVPILKSHGSAKLTITMKNLMGIVWDRRYWHRNNLNQCIADFATYRKPDLNIVDAYHVMTKNGPRGVSKADVVTMKYLIASTDMVAADAAAAKIFGMEPGLINYIQIASDMGVGQMDLSKLNISRIKV
ncbi:MAG: tat (twin-arginine translocation) pathway signal sequence [Bacteroidetes bacterium GWC2_33_15]|nr:MAG: tat (twin-arginine translocation) pathway signal sequence [Bacteroidetes bacterium GWA2_33_15]OFX52087.1 MAG: tat (twin-arginine translocation) pathway signal sequence [Bacteroidetes bacterium GWC2_33_15]OFX64241.1 MAG: tat (twin-arginine translocation) pathway signal sequence [Bacteroidetes bacterium GWB2_32_14]OFX67646.1 MAG: tat (twin-arginine translocation) pathway signal sequence [Bacteroidetes bacterium GWD2_33_33]HAN19250.1 tat (twin-arginine translocation) pathway signal sequenc